jgi:hypothetical protein
MSAACGGASRAARSSLLVAVGFAASVLLGSASIGRRALGAEPRPPASPAFEPCGSGPAPLEISFVDPPLARADATLEATRSRLVLPALRAAICDWFHDDRWRLSFTRGEALPGPGAAPRLRLAIELFAQGARLYADSPDGRWRHDVTLEAGLDDAGVEAIAEALHSTAQAASLEPRDARRRPPQPRSAPASTNPLGAETATPAPAARTAAAPAARTAAAPAAPASTLAAPAVAPTLAAPAPTAAREATRDAPRSNDATDSPSTDGASLAPSSIARHVRRGRHFPVHTALGYQAHARGAEPFMHGPVLHIELDALEHPVTLAGYFRGSAFTSGTRRTTGFAVRSSGVSLTLGAAASLGFGAVSARAAASGGVDLVALDVRVLDATLVRSLPDRRVAPRPFTGIEAGVRWRLGAFELALDALLRLLWLDTRYQVLDGERTLTLFSPWQLQPGAVLELGYVW